MKKSHLFDGIRGVGDELPDEDFFLRVQRLGHDVQQHSGFCLELILSWSTLKVISDYFLNKDITNDILPSVSAAALKCLVRVRDEAGTV